MNLLENVGSAGRRDPRRTIHVSGSRIPRSRLRLNRRFPLMQNSVLSALRASEAGFMPV